MRMAYFSAGEPGNQIEWITEAEASWPKTCEKGAGEGCHQHTKAKLLHDGSVVRYLCAEHALEAIHHSGAKPRNERPTQADAVPE